MEVGGGNGGVAGVAHVADDLAGRDPVALRLRPELLEVGVVVAVAARPHDVDHLAAQAAHRLELDDALGDAADWCIARRKDIDPFVMPAALPSHPPGVAELVAGDPVDRNGQHFGQGFREQDGVSGVVAN